MPATANAIQVNTATTPSQPICGTGRGKAGDLISSWSWATTKLRKSPIEPMTPSRNQLPRVAASWMSSLSWLIHLWNARTSWNGRASVSMPLNSAQPPTQTTAMIASRIPV